MERLENQDTLEGEKEYEMMKAQAERIRKGMLMWIIDNPVKAIGEQNVLKMKCCMYLMRALALSVSETYFDETVPINVSIKWNMVLMALVRTLEDLYLFLTQYTGLEIGEFESSEWGSTLAN